MIDVIASLAADLDEAGIPFTFDAGTALFLQGVVYEGMDDIDISVPWSHFPTLHRLFEDPSPINDYGGWAKFRFYRKAIPVDILTYKATDLATDPDRVPVQLGDRTVHVKSLGFFQRNLPPEDRRQALLAARLGRA